MPPRRAPAKERRHPADRALARLKSLCAEVVSSGADAWSPSLASLHAAADDADVLNTEISARCLWLAVGEDGLAPLLALFAAVLRRSGAPELSEELRSAHGALRTKIADELADGGISPRLDYATATALLRSHALRCYARLLADSWAQLSQRRSRRAVRAAMSLLGETYRLLGVLLSIGSHAVPELCNLEMSLDDALRLELPASGLLEHWARLLLAAAPPGEDAEEEAAVLLAGMTTHVLLVKHPVMSASCFEGPCMSYLLSSHVVRLCAALDGGCSHGLGREDVRHGAPLFDAAGRGLRQGSGQCARTTLAQLALGFWSDAIHGVHVARSTSAGASGSLPAKADGAPAQMGSWQTQRHLGVKGEGLRVQLEMLTEQMQLNCKAHMAGKEQAAGQLAVVEASLEPRRATSGAGPTPSSLDCAKELVTLKESAEEFVERLDATLVAHARRAQACVDALWAHVPQVDAMSVPPLHMQAVYRLAMRLVVCGVDAAAAAAPPPPPPGSGGRRTAAPTRRPRIAEVEALLLAVPALRCAREASLCVARAAALQPRDQERLRGYWAAALRLAATVQQSTAAGAVLLSGDVGDALKPQLPDSGPGAPGLPPGPTPDVAAALAAGWVPAVELLLRNELPGRHVHLRDLDGHRYELGPEVCAQLLAFGAPREVAALVATILKRADLQFHTRKVAPPEGRAQALVAGLADLALWASTLPVRWLAQGEGAGQRLTGPAMAAGSATAAGAGRNGEAVTAASTAAAVEEGGPSGGDGLLAATAGPGSGAGGAAGLAGGRGAAGVAGGSGAAGVAGGSNAAGVAGGSGAPQLRLLLSWVALCTLEPMARMLEDLLSCEPADLGAQAEEVGARLPLLVAPVLEWVAVLAAAYRAAADAAVASGAQLRVAEAARVASADWQHLLQSDLCVQRVLSIGLQVAATQPDGAALPGEFVAALQGAVLALARLAPRVLMRAILASEMAEQAAGGCALGPWEPTLQLLREVLGPGGACCELRVLATVEAVRAQVGGWGSSHGEGPAATGAAPEPLPPRLAELLAGGAMLAAPAELRALLPLCAYPACGARLDRPSEPALAALQRYIGLGVRGRYCSRGCHEQHSGAGRSAL